jgi:hypothetical protein
MKWLRDDVDQVSSKSWRSLAPMGAAGPSRAQSSLLRPYDHQSLIPPRAWSLLVPDAQDRDVPMKYLSSSCPLTIDAHCPVVVAHPSIVSVAMPVWVRRRGVEK